MVVTSRDEVSTSHKPDYDRASELKAFDDTKAGVKGLVDAGVTEIPRIFYHPPENLDNTSATAATGDTQFSIPVIDLQGIDKDVIKRREIVERVREAAEIWGFFQVVNHGIHVSVLEEMKEGVRRFHEEDSEVKKEFYTRDRTRPVLCTTTLICIVHARRIGGILFFVLWLLIPQSQKTCQLLAGM